MELVSWHTVRYRCVRMESDDHNYDPSVLVYRIGPGGCHESRRISTNPDIYDTIDIDHR
jgi:hypothetical protein